jgi:hypothetical protein
MSAAQMELSDDCLSRPLPADLITLGAHMLWPDDADARDGAIESGHLKILISDFVIPQEIAQQIASFALDAVPVKTLQESVKERLVRGYMAGLILRHVIREVSIDRNSEKASVGWITKQLTKPSSATPRTIENTTWKEFRKVSHFWAAYEQTFDAADRSSFPCKLENLSKFLSISEAFRNQGEETTPWKSPRPLLLPGECVSLPQHLNVPKVSIKFGSA